MPNQNLCDAMKFLSLILFLALFFPGNFVVAAENDEIEYLLSFIGSSDCIFIRNGREYQAEEAREHLEMKYNHVKRRIKTAEDFIDKIASKSSLSGRQYEVRCDGIKLQTSQWLRESLASYRVSVENQEKEKKTAE
ncbi:MAG: DUF5329 domain-containing protein [Thermodesulfobacteriota bacterium]|nr:DUF5329 domain-containing protein [Thermodesulfobacteriota bacterium]